MPKTDGICVANHTSPIDVVILSVDRPYALVGQSHPGFMGIFQVAIAINKHVLVFFSEKLVPRSGPHLVPEGAGQGQTRGGEETEGTRGGP